MISALLLSLLIPSASAFDVVGYAWGPEVMPVSWYMTDTVEDSIENATFFGYKTALEAQEQTLLDSFENWHAAECAVFSETYMGIHKGNEGRKNDGMNKMYIDDPRDQSGTGVLGVTQRATTSDIIFERDGRYYYGYEDVDITFNNDIDWGLTVELEQKCNSGTFVFEGVATHEIGHMWGMGHSCEEGEPCTDRDYLDATMYWSTGPCNLDQNSINDDDIAGMNSIYGPFATFATEGPTSGGVPLSVGFNVVYDKDETVTSTRWTFGDGETSTDMNPVHTYEKAGQFTVILDVGGEAESCPEWSYTYRELALVTACGKPEPGLSEEGERYGGLFTYEYKEGLQYQLINRTDTSVYGCIDTILWQVFDSGGNLKQEISAWSPIVEFPSEGKYRVLLNVGGPGGMSAAEMDIEVTDESAKGCSSVPFGLGLGGILAGLALGFSRRQRRR